jgi:3-hydroxyisobutyrate dehydrogenase-like beta-hydroxyacid dehydrogenase
MSTGSVLNMRRIGWIGLGKMGLRVFGRQIFAEISTVSPSASRRVVEAMSAIGVRYIRSPVLPKRRRFSLTAVQIRHGRRRLVCACIRGQLNHGP